MSEGIDAHDHRIYDMVAEFQNGSDSSRLGGDRESGNNARFLGTHNHN